MSELTITRSLPVPVDRAWLAWTEADRIAAWLWPTRFGTRCSVDVRPGGRYRFDAPAMGIALFGSYIAVEAPHRLAKTFTWDGEDSATSVTVTLAEVAGRTVLTLEHTGFAAVPERDNHVRGWNDCLDRLAAFHLDDAGTPHP